MTFCIWTTEKQIEIVTMNEIFCDKITNFLSLFLKGFSKLKCR